jgi:hypothetical protein
MDSKLMKRVRRFRLDRQSGTAIVVTVTLVFFASMASMARVVQAPVFANSGMLASLGPGAIGAIRAVKIGAKRATPKQRLALAQDALASAPLSADPFLVVALGEFTSDDSVGSPRARRLLEEAIRRDPRSRQARMLLLRNAAETGELAVAIDQIAALNRLNVSTVSRMLEAVGNSVASERQLDEAVSALSRYPELHAAFVKGFVDRDRPQPMLIRLSSTLHRRVLDIPEVRVPLLQALVQAGAFQEARRLYGSAQRMADGLVHSPDFTDRRSPPPFNWELLQNSTGVAERAEGQGISVSYYGRVPGRLAVQTLTMPPGKYRTAIKFVPQVRGRGALALRLVCVTNGAVLGRVPLEGKIGVPLTAQFTAVVPPKDCAGQYLELVGEPREGRVDEQVTVQRIDVSLEARK